MLQPRGDEGWAAAAYISQVLILELCTTAVPKYTSATSLIARQLLSPFGRQRDLPQAPGRGPTCSPVQPSPYKLSTIF